MLADFSLLRDFDALLVLAALALIFRFAVVAFDLCIKALSSGETGVLGVGLESLVDLVHCPGGFLVLTLHKKMTNV